MKKLLSLLLALTMLVALLAGCSSAPEATEEQPQTTPAEAESETPQEEAPEDQIVLIFAHNQTALDHSFHLGAVKFQEELERLSGGTMTAEIHPGDLGTNESELIEKVQLGAVDLTVASPNFMSQVGVKEVDLIALTYVFNSMDQWTRAMDGEFGEALAESVKTNTNNDFQIIGNYMSGIRHVYANKFVNTEELMAGLNIRVQNSPVTTEYWAEVGAVPASVGWGELYQALAQNTVDGAENSYVSFVLANHHTTNNGKFITETRHDYATRPMFINGEKFDSYTEEQKAWIYEAAEISEQYQRDLDASLSEELKQRAIDEGAEVYVPTDEELQFMIEPAVAQQDAFAAENGLEEALQMIRDAA